MQALESAFKEKFELQSIQLKYKMSNGNVQGLYQDFHIEKALEDSTNSGARYFQIEISGSGGPSSSASSYSAPSQPKPAGKLDLINSVD